MIAPRRSGGACPMTLQSWVRAVSTLRTDDRKSPARYRTAASANDFCAARSESISPAVNDSAAKDWANKGGTLASDQNDTIKAMHRCAGGDLMSVRFKGCV